VVTGWWCDSGWWGGHQGSLYQSRRLALAGTGSLPELLAQDPGKRHLGHSWGAEPVGVTGGGTLAF
jgi:hypothetical protein